MARIARAQAADYRQGIQTTDPLHSDIQRDDIELHHDGSPDSIFARRNHLDGFHSSQFSSLFQDAGSIWIVINN